MCRHMPYFILVIASPQEAHQCPRLRTRQVSCSGRSFCRGCEKPSLIRNEDKFQISKASGTILLPSQKSENKDNRKLV